MNIIDSNGKIFHVVNIVDAIIIIFLISIFTTFFVYVYFPPQINEHETVVFQVYLNSDYFSHPLFYPIVQPLFVSGAEIHSSVYEDRAQIIEAKIMPLATNSSEVKIFVTLNGTLSKGSDNQYLFNGYQISPGMVFPFQINDSYFIGIVQRVNYSHHTTHKKVLLTLTEVPTPTLMETGTPLFDLAGNSVGHIMNIYLQDKSYYALLLLEVDEYEDGVYFQEIPLQDYSSLTLLTPYSSLQGYIKEVSDNDSSTS